MSEATGPDDPGRNIRYSVDENPPHVLSAFLGFQVVALIVAGIALTPLVVLRAAGLEQQHGNWVVFAALLISGIATMLQARRIGPVGAGYVLFMGTSGAFIAIAIAAIVAGGMPLLATLIVASALVQFLFAARLGFLRRIVTPTVGGTVIMLIAVTVLPIGFGMLTRVPAGQVHEPWVAPAVATFTFVVTVGLSLFARGAIRLWGPLIGIVTGTLVAVPFGLLDLSAVRAAPWIGLPNATWPGLDLSFGTAFWALLPAFMIVTIVGAIETYGDGIAIQRASHRTRRPLDFTAVPPSMPTASATSSPGSRARCPTPPIRPASRSSRSPASRRGAWRSMGAPSSRSSHSRRSFPCCFRRSPTRSWARSSSSSSSCCSVTAFAW